MTQLAYNYCSCFAQKVLVKLKCQSVSFSMRNREVLLGRVTNSQALRRPRMGVCMYLMYLKAEPWLKLTAASGQASNS